MQEHHVDVRGHRISVLHRRGAGPSVLLIHGNSSCKEVFQKQLSALSRAGFGVVVPDLPGHGRSECAKRPSAAYSFPGYALILADLMDRLNAGAYHVVGWSLGGHIGLELWSRQAAVQSLLITGTPPISLSAAGAAQGFLPSPAMDLAGKRHLNPSEVNMYRTAMLGNHLDHRCRVARSVAQTDGGARYWMVRNGLAGHGVNQAHAVRTCQRPLAIIQGRYDPFVNIDYLNRLKYNNIWQGKPVLLDAGHSPHWNKPRHFNNLMVEFLRHVDNST